jgi:nucleoside-diphosphate-sugar epimerase
MWKDCSVLVTGGASFIGSHLVDSLLEKGAIVKVADDFSSGKLKNLEYPLKSRRKGTWTSGRLTVHRVDLKDRAFARKMMRDVDVIFHLAAQHGGRGYIHTHPAECCTNMALDQLVFEEAWRADVERMCFASSACVYPSYLQEQVGSSYLLKEGDADPFVRDRAFADLEYGWCLAGRSYILTREGLKEIMYVQPGEFVLAKDNSWRRVLRVHRRSLRANEDVVAIKPSRGLTASMTANHQIWTSLGWKRAQEIVGYRSGRPPSMILPEPSPPVELPGQKSLAFRYHGYRSEIATTPDLWRFLGFWTAEGTLEPHTGKHADPGYIAVSQMNRKTLEKYLTTARELDPDSKINGPQSNGMHVLRLWHQGLWRWLHEKFLATTRSYRYSQRRKTVPLWLSGLREENFRAFWVGWSEGDGKHSSDRRSDSVATSSSALAGRMYSVLRARNLPASLSMSRNRKFRSFAVSWLVSNYANYGSINQPESPPRVVYDLEIEGEDSYAIPGAFVHNSKLMAEMALRAYHREYGVKSSAIRIFTAYGERENETHAIIALIAKALVRTDPFEIWGTGQQDRNFTYVGDIVDAMILAAEKIEDASPVNAGRDDRITLNKAAELVFDLVGWRPKEIRHDLTKPEGVASRAADLTRAKNTLSWEPRVSYEEGFRKTIGWYRSHKDLRAVQANLSKMLMER